MANLLTVAEVARILGRPEGTIRSWIRSGRLESVRIGRLVRVPASAIPNSTDARRPAPPQGVDPVDLLGSILGVGEETTGRVDPLPVGNWSPTRLTAWLMCPAKGAWETGVFPLPADWAWPRSEAAEIGHIVHAYAEARLRGVDPDFARQIAIEVSETPPQDGWRPLIAGWERDVRPTIGQPRLVEGRMEVVLDGLPVTAQIDVVDERGVIRDLKTTRRAIRPTVAWESVQAPVYWAAWREQTGEEPAGFRLDYLRTSSKGAVYTPVTVPVTEAAIDRVRRQLAWAQDLATRPDRIIPNPMTRYGCAGCDFRDLCAERFGFPQLEGTEVAET
ncbi:HTH cro/C1-type domain-containing protein [Candidatus Hydrogenisulfobacillus filiaventi]|uniref:HTH cro/C1-type domain-containing protein n=1 Tax=Candidatus Hydrogenisulfobacillus filiaventi TaxID=2707344 RepID=A0A6F8ZHW8_9FIRM|nr:HTH cro/C1-type domain-containing protein [Candidatus Hydrogenisulfobacillus filiaventi]